MSFKKHAFSLIELLITIAIISLLLFMGVKFYSEQKEKSDIRIAQAEMIEILKYAKMAKTTDGAYHQFIYQMGYTPKGKITSVIGTASRTTPCCNTTANAYPSLGTSPCSKSQGTVRSYNITAGERCGPGFICNGCDLGSCPTGSTCSCQGEQAYKTYSYYNCRNDSLNKATYNMEICKDSNYNEECDISSDHLYTSFPSFSKCTPSPSTWCDCDNFMVGAKSKKSYSQELTLNHENKLCSKK